MLRSAGFAGPVPLGAKETQAGPTALHGVCGADPPEPETLANPEQPLASLIRP